MAFQDGYLSDFVGRQAVVEEGGRRKPVGKIVDFLVRKPDDTFPKVDGFILKTRGGDRLAYIGDVERIERNGPALLRSAPTEVPEPEHEALYLVRDLLDKQIVDVDGRKVRRINDIEVANTGGTLRVVAADVGVSGLLHRLGAARFMPSTVSKVPRSLIAWNSVAPINDPNPSQVQLSVSGVRLARLHPSELADIIEELSTKDAARVVKSLDDETAADAFEHMESERQRELIEDLGPERAADIIEEMDSDDAADLLGELDEEKQAELLAEMEPETAGELRSLVEYEPDTAGGLMTTDYVWIYPHRTVQATVDKIREIGPESEFIYYLYVTDHDRKLLGVLSLRTLLLALPTGFIHKLMDSDVVAVGPDVTAEEVASTIARYDLLAVPVLDDHGRMLGIVTVDDAIDAIIPEKIAKSLPHFTRHHKKAAVAVAGD